MDRDIRDSVFTLLYIMVLIDEQILRIEVDTFLSLIEEFQKTKIKTDRFQSKTIVTDWFMQNYKSILRAMGEKDRGVFIDQHISRLSDFYDREVVFDFMTKIAFSDNQFHDDERQVLERAAKVWGLKFNIETTT